MQNVLYAPINGRNASFGQNFVTFGEVTASEKASVRRQWTWMHGHELAVNGISDDVALISGICAPEKEHNRSIFFV